MPTSKDNVRLQKRAELLHSRIEELDRHLALLNSERDRFEKLLAGGRRMDDSHFSNSPRM
jgi:hypothetical protein